LLAESSEHLKEMGWTPEQMGKNYSQAIRITPTKFHAV
jgi:hypothetical protein